MCIDENNQVIYVFGGRIVTLDPSINVLEPYALIYSKNYRNLATSFVILYQIVLGKFLGILYFNF